MSIFSCAAYMSSPCHIELILSEKEEPVKKEVKFVLDLYILWCLGRVVHKCLVLWWQPETQLATSKSKKGQALRSGASS